MGTEKEDDDGETGIDDADGQTKWSHHTGPYFLQPLLDNVQLAVGGDDKDSSITCVELWEGNLYIGTSQGQVLHFVLLPAEGGDDISSPDFMLASRTQLQAAAASSRELYPIGVRQILLLPRANKACILSNGVLTFYSLPELSPAYASTPVRNCNWVGGVDLHADESMGGDGEVVMLSRKSRISLVRIGNGPRPVVVRNIEYPGSLTSARRGSFACVANSTSYDLLDVDHQQKIPLFPISSVQPAPEDPVPSDASGARSSEAAETRADRPSSPPTTQHARTGSTQGHGRSTSLGAFVAGFTQRGQSPRPRSSDGLDQDQLIGSEETLRPAVQPESGRVSGRSSGPSVNATHDKVLPPTPAEIRAGAVASPEPPPARSESLRPHVTSPTPTEFLLTTGTTKSDAGVGIFVNLDGDVCRGTIQFSRYPEDVVVDCLEPGPQGHPARPEGDAEDFCLALIDDAPEHGVKAAIEIQSLGGHAQGAAAEDYRSRLSVPGPSSDSDFNESGEGPPKLGIRKLGSPFVMTLSSLSGMLQLVRLRLPRRRLTPGNSPGIESSSRAVTAGTKRSSKDEHGDAQGASRSREEEHFARRFSRQQCQLVLWSGNRVWWIVRNAVAVRLDAKLEAACPPRSGPTGTIDRQRVADVLGHIRGQEPASEAHFVSLGYIRQKASLILFSGLMEASSQRRPVTEEDTRLAEETLQEGMIDPRVIMGMVPFLREDVYESEGGVWVHGGVRAYLESHAAAVRTGSRGGTDTGPGEPSQDLLRLLRAYLSGWRRKKGFGSIGDEKQIFESVDAGLLHALLEADKRSMSSGATGDSARSELYALVDQGLDCFEWAVELLERYRRLYVLSRLHQSRKLSERVLATWKRILEGESDSGEELPDGENEMRRYLSRIRDAAVVAEYGTWLAQRNPTMGIQVFTDSNSRVRLEPAKVIEILKRRAPDALKRYLEHLVFGRNELRFANDLVMFYLDSVLSVLGGSDRARSILARSYETYRSLRPPRPTYREFITANAVDETWWSDRLRLLELLGGSHGAAAAAAAAAYDVPLALARVEPFEKELVPEMIILDGKQDRHRSALRLLTHGLGDYGSAVNYCLLGGSGIFHPTFGAERPRSVPSHDEQAELFGHLLSEFLQIEDADHRAEQTGRLLERFGRWYDEDKVLAVIPETWALDLMAGYFVGALRRIHVEHSETTMVKALSGAENVQVQVRFVDRCEELGPSFETSD